MCGMSIISSLPSFSRVFFLIVIIVTYGSTARDIDEVLELLFLLKVIFKKITEFVQHVCVLRLLVMMCGMMNVVVEEVFFLFLNGIFLSGLILCLLE